MTPTSRQSTEPLLRHDDYRNSITDDYCLSRTAQAVADVESSAYYMGLVRERAARPHFDTVRYLDELSCSQLRAGARRTMEHLEIYADSRGLIRVSGQCVAKTLACRPNTISDHWRKAREAGYLVTLRRFNAASIQRLTWPGGDHAVPDDLPNTIYRPLTPGEWSAAEREWFANLDPHCPLPGPWNSGKPPF